MFFQNVWSVEAGMNVFGMRNSLSKSSESSYIDVMEEHDTLAEVEPVRTEACCGRPKKEGGLMKQGCTVVVLALILVVVSSVAGMLGLYALQQKGIFGGEDEGKGSTSYVLDRKQICELAFEQSGLLCDTDYECKWKLDIPLLHDVEMGKAVVKVKGVYLVKFGIDPEKVKLWEFYPSTSELQVSIPAVKLVSIQTEAQEISMEDESWLKKLQKEDRNEAMLKNRLEAEARARRILEEDPKIKQECIEQLRKLLASVGVRLVLVEEMPPIS